MASWRLRSIARQTALQHENKHTLATIYVPWGHKTIQNYQVFPTQGEYLTPFVDHCSERDRI